MKIILHSIPLLFLIGCLSSQPKNTTGMGCPITHKAWWFKNDSIKTRSGFTCSGCGRYHSWEVGARTNRQIEAISARKSRDFINAFNQSQQSSALQGIDNSLQLQRNADMLKVPLQ